MNIGKRQVIAEKIASTVRVLELLGFHDYEVTAPRNQRDGGNKSPRVVRVDIGQKSPLRIYNSSSGYMWANMPDGTPIPGIRVPEDLYRFLESLADVSTSGAKKGRVLKRSRRTRKSARG